MAYILKRRRPTAKQSYNTFKAVTRITELANGNKDAAESLLSKMYYKAATIAAAEPGRMVSVFPPGGNGLWSWNRSFDIACDVASQVSDAEIPIAVPEEANIFIGKEIIDMDEDEARDALDALDFDFDKHMDDDLDVISHLVEKEENKPRWLGDFGGEIDRSFQRDALLDIEETPELPDEKPDWEQEAEDIERIVNDTEQTTFADFLNEKMIERNLTPARLARKANMMTSTLVKLREAENPVPTKSQIFAIGLALELEREEFEHLLLLAGYCLSECVPRDRIVSYYLDRGVYSLAQINRALFVHNIPTLGTHAPVAK